MRPRAGRLATLALAVGCVLVSWPLWVQVVAAQAPAMPPAGTVVVAFGLSDGLTVLPVGSALIPAGALCGGAE